MRQLAPILASLKRHKLTSSVLVIQVALTFAVICNVAFMISNRVGQINVVSGLDESSLSVVRVTDLTKHLNIAARHETDLAEIRRIPGVELAAAVDTLPFNDYGINLVTCTRAESLGRVQSEATYAENHCVATSVFDGTRDTRKTLGLTLEAGRDFLPDEMIAVGPGQVIPDAPAAIVSAAYANQLFGGNAVGKSVFLGVPGRKEPLQLHIVGIVTHLLKPRLQDASSNENTILISGLPGSPIVTYVMKTRSDARLMVAKKSAEALLRIDPNRLIPAKSVTTFSRMRQTYFQSDVTMIKLLMASAAALFCVTAFGIAGLANFWVQQRQHTIGIRRALGATQGEIRGYFLLENCVIVAGGVLIGVLAAWTLNMELIEHYAFARLPVLYYVIAAGVLLLLGQGAALGPAIRASVVPPVFAMRQVA